MSPKTWVVVSGGILGILAMRFVVGRLLVLVERYPTSSMAPSSSSGGSLSSSAPSTRTAAGYTDIEIPHWTSLIVIVLVLAAAYTRGAASRGPMPVHDEGPQLDEP
jgi:hypothetical protein